MVPQRAEPGASAAANGLPVRRMSGLPDQEGQAVADVGVLPEAGAWRSRLQMMMPCFMLFVSLVEAHFLFLPHGVQTIVAEILLL